jgi:hypothetical protein
VPRRARRRRVMRPWADPARYVARCATIPHPTRERGSTVLDPPEARRAHLHRLAHAPGHGRGLADRRARRLHARGAQRRSGLPGPPRLRPGGGPSPSAPGSGGAPRLAIFGGTGRVARLGRRQAVGPRDRAAQARRRRRRVLRVHPRRPRPRGRARGRRGTPLHRRGRVRARLHHAVDRPPRRARRPLGLVRPQPLGGDRRLRRRTGRTGGADLPSRRRRLRGRGRPR